jgi:hypothetical protein
MSADPIIQPDQHQAALAAWLVNLGLDGATVLAVVPNQLMDGLSPQDLKRLSGLLTQEHHYRQHDGFVAAWNAARTRDEIGRLTGQQMPNRTNRDPHQHASDSREDGHER